MLLKSLDYQPISSQKARHSAAIATCAVFVFVTLVLNISLLIYSDQNPGLAALGCLGIDSPLGNGVLMLIGVCLLALSWRHSTVYGRIAHLLAAVALPAAATAINLLVLTQMRRY